MTDALPIVSHQPPLCLLALLEFQETRSACVKVCGYACVRVAAVLLESVYELRGGGLGVCE